MRHRITWGLGIAGLVLASWPLAAQELHYGGQVTASLPAGPLSSKDWLDGQVGGGVGFGVTKFELTGFGYSSSDTPNTAYVAASAGWMFTPHLGAELRYEWSKYKPDVTGFAPRGYTGKPDVDAPTINASFIVRL